MSQGKQNKFLTIYFSVLGVGALALGYLGWSASSSAEAAEKSYKDKVIELDRLEKASLSRTKENADKKKKLVDEYVTQVQAMNTSMLAWQVPANETETGESFQKKLIQAVKTAKEDGLSKQVKVPEKFDFGMEKYLASFPVGTAPRLSAQLDSLIFLVNAAMDAGVSSIDSMIRTELAFESEKPEEPAAPAGNRRPATPPAAGSAAARTAARNQAAPEKDKPAVDESKVLERQPLALTITGKNKSVLSLLEALANASPGNMAPHFFVIRTLRVENQLKDGPAKTQTVEIKEEEITLPDGTKKTIKRDAMYLLGNEQVRMSIELDLIRFVAVPSTPEKPAARTANAN